MKEGLVRCWSVFDTVIGVADRVFADDAHATSRLASSDAGPSRHAPSIRHDWPGVPLPASRNPHSAPAYAATPSAETPRHQHGSNAARVWHAAAPSPHRRYHSRSASFADKSTPATSAASTSLRLPALTRPINFRATQFLAAESGSLQSDPLLSEALSNGTFLLWSQVYSGLKGTFLM